MIKLWIISSVVIYLLSFSIIEIKMALLPREIRIFMTRKFDVSLIIKCFVPVYNLLILYGAIVWEWRDIYK